MNENETVMVDKLLVLPYATLQRLYKLAHAHALSPDAMLTRLIDKASRELSVTLWLNTYEEALEAERFQRRLTTGTSGF
jgi:hypothetical protein